MLTTEAEAATKRCHRDMRDTCIGSMCMAWRNVEAVAERKETSLGQMPKGNGWRQVDRGDSYGLVWERQLSAGGGYCGLAGTPQRT